MEGSHDYRYKSGLGRPLPYHHAVKTWMAGTSPAMTISMTSRLSPQRLQFGRQRVGPLRDIAGAEADDKIAAGGNAVDDAGKIGGFLQRDYLAMAVSTQAKDKMIAVDASDRRLARRIDFRDHDGIGVIETGTK